MASTQLTDEELFSELKRFGFTSGPITENTRPVYLKKLKKLREEQQQRLSRQAKARSGAAAAAAASTPGSRPASHDVTHLSASRRPGRKSSVLSFSSDESDAESPFKRKEPNHNGEAEQSSGLQPQTKTRAAGAAPKSQRGTASTTPTENDSAPDRGGRRGGSLVWGVRARASLDTEGRDYDESVDGDDCEEGTEKNSHPSNGCGLSRLSASKLAGDYSDSDEEGVGGLRAEQTQDRLQHRRSHPRAALPSRGDGGVNSHDGFNMVGSRDEDEAARRRSGSSGGGGARSHSFARTPIGGSLSENHVDGARVASGGGSGRFVIGLRPRFSSYSSLSQIYRGSNHGAPGRAYSRAGPEPSAPAPPEDDELLQQFKREEASPAGGFSAHYLSMFLLTAACLFFLLLGLMYLRMGGSVIRWRRNLILKLLLSLHNHLAHVAGQHDCGDQQHPNRSLSMDEALAYLRAQNQDFDDFIYTSIEWIIKGQDVGIRLTGQVADDPVTDVSEISRLESTHPRMPFTCRFRRAFVIVISRVFLVALGGTSSVAAVCYVKYRWRREEEEARRMYDMVEKIVDVLRSHSEACQENQDLQPYLPIPHVRDSLVHPQDRKKTKKIWELAVRFLSANESRIRTETQRIGGADFLVWRWIQPSLSCDKTSTMPSKVWQGKAFPLDRRNSPPNSLTPCLKIRNMFDPAMEVGDNWDLAIREAILEKCNDNDGIVHVAVDKDSREGCVYVKCLSAEHSGKAFKALHGSWFDGKLVTVKYLRLDRYHQRFPQTQSCSTPLKASSPPLNNTSPRLQPCSSANISGFS
ncbi:inner nuclear membrane protein Man1 [Brachionichthys hirsutus]|uniref:inner nuclear membrane protein Man1 n=1 Tax=Brachionichthys hirsutus TaxID=412623 RepID=UPI0036044E35